MKANTVKYLRKELELEVPKFSKLLGVSPSTGYRWELSSEKNLKLAPLQTKLLQKIQSSLMQKNSEEKKTWRKHLARSLKIGGTLAALAFILKDMAIED